MLTRTPAPWHLWLFGGLALLWHIGTVADYLATQFEYEPYISQIPPEWLAYFATIPLWVDAAWAVGVWGGLLGAVLLLMRASGAVLVFAFAALAMLAVTVWLMLISDPTMQAVTGMDGVWVMVGACVGAVLLWLYARWLKAAGVLA